MDNNSNKLQLLLLSLFLLAITAVHSRSVPYSTPSDLISDGINGNNNHNQRGPQYLLLNPFIKAEEESSSSTCEQTYGFLPCTTTVLGNLFLIIVYGYLMYVAATYLSNGSELLLEILGPGVVGGLFLPILGALPDAMLILGLFFSLLFFWEIIFKIFVVVCFVADKV